MVLIRYVLLAHLLIKSIFTSYLQRQPFIKQRWMIEVYQSSMECFLTITPVIFFNMSDVKNWISYLDFDTILRSTTCGS